MQPYYDNDGITIYHGDCREILPLIDADVMVTDPPYGIAWTKPEYMGGRAHSGIANDSDLSARDEILAAWGDRPAVVFGSSVAALPRGTRQVLAWKKGPDAGLFGSVAGYRRDWEPIYLVGRWESRPADRSSVISHPHVNGRGKGQPHPHEKPSALLRLLIERCPSGTVLDPFMGSGTTLRAAKDIGRRAIGIEIEERYCEIAVHRLGQMTLGLEAA